MKARGKALSQRDDELCRCSDCCARDPRRLALRGRLGTRLQASMRVHTGDADEAMLTKAQMRAHQLYSSGKTPAEVSLRMGTTLDTAQDYLLILTRLGFRYGTAA